MKNGSEVKLVKGDKVKTVNGTIETVMVARDSEVITYESAARGNWFHPSKVWKVEE